MIHWVVQTNLGNSDDIAKMTGFLDRLLTPWSPITVIPFDDSPIEAPTDGQVIFYGSTTLMKNVAREGKWSPGVFFDEPRFEFPAMIAGYGQELLNSASEVVSIGEFLQRDIDPETEYFIRPAGDLKEFSGELRTFGEMLPWKDGLASSSGPLGLSTLIQVAPPLHIHREWRTVIVDGKVAASSQYRVDGRLNVKDPVPEEVEVYAEAMAAKYAPAPVFMLDVGETEAGLRVVETNCFNSSGFYWCDLYKVIKAVNAYLRRSQRP